MNHGTVVSDRMFLVRRSRQQMQSGASGAKVCSKNFDFQSDCDDYVMILAIVSPDILWIWNLDKNNEPWESSGSVPLFLFLFFPGNEEPSFMLRFLSIKVYYLLAHRSVVESGNALISRISPVSTVSNSRGVCVLLGEGTRLSSFSLFSPSSPPSPSPLPIAVQSF